MTVGQKMKRFTREA